MKLDKIIAMTVLACSLTACNDWLDVESSTEMDRTALFKDEAGFADAMSGIYVNMSKDELYGKELTWHALELMGGGAKPMYGENVNYQEFCFHPDAKGYMESMRNSFVDAVWNKMYNTIANVNSVLGNIDEKQGVFTGNDYAVFKGEALGLRAFLHFELMRLFGDAYSSSSYEAKKTYIPYVTSLSSSVYPLLTLDQCCELVLKDLEEAKELLKNDPMYTGASPSEYVCSEVTGSASNRTKYHIKDWHNRRFHFNYYAAVATMARVYLWKGDKEKALACAKEVIQAEGKAFAWVTPQLVSNTQSTSEYLARDRTFCTEQIFAMNITDMDDRTDGYLREGEKSFTGATVLIQGFDDSCFDAVTRQYDLRYAYLKSVQSVYGNELCISTKYYKDKDSGNSYSPWATNRVPLIRWSEMFYIAAECEPDLATAIGYLDQVRSHRGLASYPLESATREELDSQIELEYRKEFIAEGQTFYYYKRLNKEITNKSLYQSTTISPKLFTFPRPDDEDSYGGRTE